MSNRLAKESSPYLLQHANNPVDWYPWGEEALTKAKVEDKPILLSIGYSACHWCHVMAHESFENVKTARLMNDNFVNIKVDREERPDLDSVYMEAVQSLTGRGGWPLTVFLTPEAKPFYGGTYFPPEDRYGMPSFSRVLSAAADAFKNRRVEVEQTTKRITESLSSRPSTVTDMKPLVTDIIGNACLNLKQDFDRDDGGFGQAPKFPQPMVLEFLLRYFHRSQDKAALDMVTLTLEKMARGGIYDQIGGGFHRYSTDGHWLVPHFEKMLYDNTLLSQLYLHAYLVTRNPLFRRVVEETLDYLLREMASPYGGFYSTQDADSEGAEGKYYLWTLDEIIEALGEERGRIVADYYGVNASGNFDNRSILYVPDNHQTEEPSFILDAKASLIKWREQRAHPGRDEKILASWNGLALSSLAEAACALDRQDYLSVAVSNGSFLMDSMTKSGYLRHTFKDGHAKGEGYLEDYAMVIGGLISLHQATFSSEYLKQAIRFAYIIAQDFWDETAGTFYDTSSRHDSLFVRPRSTHDGSLPCGASAATLEILKISRLTGNKQFEQIGERSLRSLKNLISRYPLGFGHWLNCLDFYLSTPQEIVMVGAPNHPEAMALRRILCDVWLPNMTFSAVDPDDQAPASIEIYEGKVMVNERPAVYICQNYACLPPINEPDALRKQLEQYQG